VLLGRKVPEQSVTGSERKSNTSKRYTAEFKRDAVAPALSSDKTVTEVARDLGVSPEAGL
jgi:transposase-like protein